MEEECYDHRKVLQVQSGDGDDDEEEDSADSSVAYDDTSHNSKRRKAIRRKLGSGAQALALKRGKKLQENLREHPSFIKQLQSSHVTCNFELGVPAEFCRLHLPVHKVDVIFEDESGESYAGKFFPGSIKARFVWKRFSVAHELVEGDVAAFHLVGPCYFKVYIIKADDPTVHANEGTKESLGMSSLLPNPDLEPRPDHSRKKHSSDIDISLSSERAADSLGHRQPDMKVQSGKQTEEDSSDSLVAYDSCHKSKRRKATWGEMCSGAHALALKRGKKLQANLSREHPSFIKQMQSSHVTHKFDLGVPAEFCRLHLPVHKVDVIFEDESGESYAGKFFPSSIKGRFGWKRFSVAHDLVEGDVAAFHLVRPCYFKVYIIKADDPTVVESTNLTSVTVLGNEGMKERKFEDAGCRLAHRDNLQEGLKMSSLLSNYPDLERRPYHSRKEHSSEMDISPSSERASDCGYHRHPDNMKVKSSEQTEEDSSDSWNVQTGEEEELSNSSCMVISKQPSLRSHISTFSKRVPSHCRKKTYDQVAYDGYQTSRCCMTKRDMTDSVARALVLKRAKELQKNLPSENPSFIKQMQPSYFRKFELVLAAEFCRLHLPKHEAEVTLEAENGERYEVKFHPSERNRFYAGWKRFSAAQKLLEGDVLVLHLLRPCYFKVFIVRLNDPNGVGCANVRSFSLHANEGKKKRKFMTADRKGGQECVKRWSTLSNRNLEPGLDHYITEELHSSGLEACTLSGRDADFENFRIIVNGEIIDPELSTSTRFKYYKLCCSRESFLHEYLLKNVNSKLAAEIIKGTLQVADAIRACKLTTSKDDFAMWDNTLEGFRTLGMDIGFLRERLKELARIESEFRETERVKKYLEAKKKRDSIRDYIKSIKHKLLNLEEDAQKLDDVMKIMKVDIVECKDTFLEKANAPW